LLRSLLSFAKSTLGLHSFPNPDLVGLEIQRRKDVKGRFQVGVVLVRRVTKERIGLKVSWHVFVNSINLQRTASRGYRNARVHHTFNLLNVHLSVIHLIHKMYPSLPSFQSRIPRVRVVSSRVYDPFQHIYTCRHKKNVLEVYYDSYVDYFSNDNNIPHFPLDSTAFRNVRSEWKSNQVQEYLKQAFSKSKQKLQWYRSFL